MLVILCHSPFPHHLPSRLSRHKAKRLERSNRGKKTDPLAVGSVLKSLPVLVACNDLRALTELEPGNRPRHMLNFDGHVKLVTKHILVKWHSALI